MHPTPSSADSGTFTLNNQSCLKQGRLSYFDPEKKLLLRPGLEQRFANATRRKVDAPQIAQRDEKAAERLALIPELPSHPEIELTYWARVESEA